MNAIIILIVMASVVAVPAQRDPSKISPRNVETTDTSKSLENLPRTRIVGGELAVPHSFPFAAFLDVTVPTGTTQCGASVIASEWILTAAHCVDKTVNPVEVTVGSYLIYEEEDSAVTTTSSEIFVHPRWNRTAKQNDIALIKLSKKLQFNALIQPVKLPARSQQAETYTGLQATAIGWGFTEDGSPIMSDKQRCVTVPVISNCNCSAQLGVANIAESQICTSGAGGKNPCTGDSGGPLVLRGADGDYTQVGVVSFGNYECAAGLPNVYTRVSGFLDWISSISNLAVRGF
ncbi:brachyurin-like [Bacillus rossius redtenbacheri]|uniref:brachyurin-like n=1 Tax=Bacillus rossius redtenbacheri TaxID=93214 RepID=UPI002FDDA2C9